MRRLWLVLGIIFGLFLIFSLHLTLVFLLPYPYHTANFLLATLIALMIVFDSGKIIWYGCLLFWCLELYSSTPYGVVLYAGTLTLLCMYWLYRLVITNRSLLAALALTTAAVFSYRLLFSLLLFFTAFFGAPQTPLAWVPLVHAFIWEILFTNVLMIPIFLVIRPWYARN